MRKMFLAFAAAVALSAVTVPAHALTVDFTNSSHFNSGDLSQNYAFGGGSVTASLSSNGTGTLSFQTFDGDNTVASLAFNNDGIGVGDDEITNGVEEVAVTFSEAVFVTGFHFLDLYVAQGNGDKEVAEVYRNNILVGTFMASLVFQLQGGYLFEAVASPILADMLIFKAALGNDAVGQADYALAAIDITPVPLPAALPLLGGGLGIMALLGWRRKRIAAA